jgi:hypothetical protein
MPLPDDGPATTAKVKAQLKIADNADDAALGDIVAAVNAVVRGLPVVRRLNPDPDPGPFTWPANVVHGANMLAGRLFRRRNSPTGIEAFGANGPVYVNRNDPDVAMMLELGDYARPSVG